jgi:nitronate monooxygenase
MSFAEGSHEFKAWRDVWSAGHSVSGVHEVSSVSALVERMAAEYEAARSRLAPNAS